MAKETDLTRSFLIYAASCLRQEDLSALRDIGFTEGEADAVGKLTIRQLALLEEKLEGGLLRASLDSEPSGASSPSWSARRSSMESRSSLPGVMPPGR